MGYIPNNYRIIQLMPTSQKYEAYFVNDGKIDESTEPIICFALLETWEDGEKEIEKYQVVVPMIKDEFNACLCPATDISNYKGFREV